MFIRAVFPLLSYQVFTSWHSRLTIFALLSLLQINVCDEMKNLYAIVRIRI